MLDELRARLESSLSTSYVVERELGGGGMSRVFLARETALGRSVVIKVLLPELAAGLSARRFEREIKLAASLQQANIMPVLSAGETGGLPYYIMPFVEGRSLRESLERDGRPPLDKTVAILRDVARALAYAHEHGVVHRDIKPANILLSGDAAVVTDFGIAKAIVAARDDQGGAGSATTVTVAGMAIGTPAYMAPEQITSGPIDHRADLYSFGCVAYELLAGTSLFQGASVQTLLTAHLTQAPTPLGERCPECPPALARLVMQCLEKDPEVRPQSARELLRGLETVVRPATGFQRFSQRWTRQQRVGALGVAMVLAGGGAAVLLRPLLSPPVVSASSVAVVPFLNLSGDPDEAYLADGIADGLATALGKVSGVRVVSRSLSYRYKGQRVLDAREVGRALSAGLLLHGALRGAGERMRVSVQLTSAEDNSELWSESYDSGTEDVLAVQDSITRAIVEALQGRLEGVARTAVAAATVDPEAYDLYLRGRFLLQRRGTGVRQAIEKFEQAIVKDSSFARAHAGLALAMQLLPYFERVSPAALRERSVAAAERALRSDSTLAEALTALALAYQHAYQWAAAEAAYRRALALEHNEPDAHIQYGRFLFYTGRFQEARLELERARALDPYSAVASGWVGHMKDLSGAPAEGLNDIRRALEIDSTNPPSLAFAAEALMTLDRRDEARAMMERLWLAFPQWRTVAASILARAGSSDRARELIRVEELNRPLLPLADTRLVMLYNAVGDTAAALDALERATEAGEIWPTYYALSERLFDPLRRSPRFAAVIRQVKLDERIFASPTGGRPR